MPSTGEPGTGGRGSKAIIAGPSVRGTYGLLVGVGAAVLTVGLLLPFVVAEPAAERLLSSPAPSIVAPGRGSADPAAAGEAAATGVGAAESGAGGGSPTAANAGGSGPVAGSGEAGGAAAEERTASDVGITADAIRVGIPVPDTSAFGDVEGGARFGEAFGDLQGQWQAAIDDLNARGGIGGRRVEPVYRLYDVVDPESMRAACIYLTEEQEVFAVLGGFYGDTILCLTEQHGTPMLGPASEPDDFYQRSAGLFFSLVPSKDRLLRDLAHLLHRDGLLQGRTIGILDQEGIDAIPVDRTLLPTLDRLGYRVAYHARIANDAGAAQSQIPLEVQRMRGAQVDVVITASGLIRATVFALEADAQRYVPVYYLSDFASGATDLYTAAMPDSFEGAVGYTTLRTGEARAGLPEAAHDAACRQTYERETGDALDPTTLEYFYAVIACGVVGLFERAMGRAGVNPTRASFSQALQGLGTFEVPYGAQGSFGPGKFDAADSARRVSWHADCRCWLPVDGFQPAPR